MTELQKTTKQFFDKVQNKIYYAVHGHTAAELIYERADAENHIWDSQHGQQLRKAK